MRSSAGCGISRGTALAARRFIAPPVAIVAMEITAANITALAVICPAGARRRRTPCDGAHGSRCGAAAKPCCGAKLAFCDPETPTHGTGQTHFVAPNLLHEAGVSAHRVRRPGAVHRHYLQGCASPAPLPLPGADRAAV